MMVDGDWYCCTLLHLLLVGGHDGGLWKGLCMIYIMNF